MKTRGLTAAQVREFLDDGVVALRGCFPRAAAAPLIASAYRRMGCAPLDAKSWTEETIRLPGQTSVAVPDFAPRAWEAICGLVGGERRLMGGAPMQTWSDSFIVKFPRGPSPSRDPRAMSWHIDGPRSPRFLDDPEPGLVAYVLWSDLKPTGGGTWLALDSVGPVARCLAARPEGLDKQELPCHDIAESCRRLVRLSGKAGDVFLAHPLMLHTESRNEDGPPRFFTVRNVALTEPMDFNRPRAEDFSPVELAVLRGLGVERLDFRRVKPKRR